MVARMATTPVRSTPRPPWLDEGPLFALLIALIFGLILAEAARSQVARVTNYAPARYAGWKRLTVDTRPPHDAGTAPDGTAFVLGRQVGVDTWTVDLRVDLRAGEARSIDLAAARPAPFQRGALPANPAAHFGGAATFAGVPLSWLSIRPDGAGYLAELRGRVGRMLCATAWLHWYPDQPGWCHGELLLIASNPGVPDMGELIPRDARLRFGDALVFLPGAGPNGTAVANVPVMAEGDRLADGQGRAVPFVLVWPRHLQRASVWSSASAAAELAVAGVGIGQLTATGNPRLPPGFSALAWARANEREARRRLHTWDWLVFGPAARSNDTGSHAETVFTCAEPLQPDGVGCELVHYLSALKLAERPCHHLEVDGSPLDASRHTNPRLLLWDMRAHWHEGVSPDRLGKPRTLDISETHGRWGADVEHWFQFTLTAAARYTGSPALQHLLATQARHYPLQWTTTPGWATSQAYAARSVGWEASMVVALHRQLEDRVLAAATVAHWRSRWRMVLRPALFGRDWWDVRLNDPRLGAGEWVIAWQQVVGAYFLDVAGEVFNVPEARAVALQGARAVLRDAWTQGPDGQWHAREQLPVAPDGVLGGTGIWRYYGMALAPAVVLRHDPRDEKARAIWAVLVGGARTFWETRWLAPEVR